MKDIALIVLDTVRFDIFKEVLNDDEALKTAVNGLSFEKAYANCCWTLPSHYSMFTGQLPHEHGVTTRNHRNGVDTATLPEWLSQKGYTTIGISNNGYVSPSFGFQDLFDQFIFNGGSLDDDERLLIQDDPIFERMKEKTRNGEWKSGLQKYHYLFRSVIKQRRPSSLLNALYYKLSSWKSPPDKGAQKTVEQVRSNDILSENPFFLFINLVEAHAPYEPDTEFIRSELDQDQLREAQEAIARGTLSLLQEGHMDAEILTELYRAEIRYLGTILRELREILEEKSDDLLLIITSDHGEYLGEQGLWGHQAHLSPPVLEVPFCTSEPVSGNGPLPLRGLNNFIQGVVTDEPTDIRQDTCYAFYEGIQSQMKLDIDLPPAYHARQYCAISDAGYRTRGSDGSTSGDLDIEITIPTTSELRGIDL